jgi:hypothetical protein
MKFNPENPFMYAMIAIGLLGIFALAASICLIPSAYNSTFSEEELKSEGEDEDTSSNKS